MASDAPLVFQGSLTLDDVTDIQRYHDLLLLRRPFRWLAGLFTTALAILCSSAAIWLNGPNLVTGIVIVVWLCVLLGPWEKKLRAQRHYRKHPEDYPESRVTLTEDRVWVENEERRSDYLWRLVGLVCDTPKGLLFCDRAYQVLFWLPGRLFEGNKKRDEVLQLVARNHVRMRQLP